MSIETRKNKSGQISYQVTVWLSGVKAATKTFYRKSDAQDWERRQTLSLQSGELTLSDKNSLTLNHFFEDYYWINHGLNDQTAHGYRQIFEKWAKPQLGDRFINSISESEWVKHFSSLLIGGLSKTRSNRVRTTMSAIYREAVKQGIVKNNPIKAVQQYREPLVKRDHWTEEDVTSFFQWADDTDCFRTAFYRCAYETGMRLAELCALQHDAIDFNNGLIEVRRTLCHRTNKALPTTKNGHQRVVPIGEELTALLKKETLKGFGPFVFIQPNGRPYTYNYLRKNFPKDQQTAKVKQITLHGIRHTFASHFIMKGGGLYDLMEILGHSDVQTTRRYAHLSSEYLRDKMNIMNTTRILRAKK